MGFAMTRQSDRKSASSAAAQHGAKPDLTAPGWAKGLRQLYDSVVDEPLPDSFDDLLKKLDQAGHD